MRQRQETHRDILFGNIRQPHVVRAQHLQKTVMMEDDPFGFARSAGGVDKAGNVFWTDGIHAYIHHYLGVRVFARSDKIVEIHGSLVFGMKHHVGIKNNQLLQHIRLLLHLEGVVVLKLLAYKQHVDFGVVDDVFHLRRRGGGKDRHHDSPVGIDGKISVEILPHVLRIDADALFGLHADFRHGPGNAHDSS